MIKIIIFVVAYLVLAPLVGGFLAGIDRIISARMQGRVGPPVLQPFYDVFKLREKEAITVNKVQDFYVTCFFIFVLVTGCFFFAGGDLLLVIFTLTLASVFLIVAAFSSNSPYSQVGAERELLQMLAYEPMVLLTAIGFYIYTGSFEVRQILSGDAMAFLPLIGVFFGFIFILTIKFRKSPFDLSMSHHAHQELVKGLVTEFSGKTMALIEVAHWYENIFLLGFVFLFFANGTIWGTVIGVVVCLAAYFLEVLIDNCFARMKWQVALNSAWIVALVLGMINLFIVYLV
ncbi:NADH-quinone oxidoreductase subunit H [Anaerovorax odorimutans]|uniref:NADH-quinone oxidoreductase subunit H n=1 Tax=Anaerovorax odorimutans TaxID=109327 RepID=A0ABT1RJY4_9FIRM|nr:complex I subunit 1 family protein [Anaerovorax odorimutans]MCQ4635484.1 NADH-quinone oxidoreductase subunit H [Anaerovorax odorimutans]